MRREGAAERSWPKRLPIRRSIWQMRYMPEENLTPDKRSELLTLLRDQYRGQSFPWRLDAAAEIGARQTRSAALAASTPLPRPSGWANSTTGRKCCR